MHGGAAGSGAPIGNTNALRHGHYTAEAIARRRQLSELIRTARATLAEIEERDSGSETAAVKCRGLYDQERAGDQHAYDRFSWQQGRKARVADAKGWPK